MTLKNNQLTSRITKSVVITGLILSLVLSISNAIPVFAGSAGYMGADMSTNITELKGNVLVYSDLMSSSSDRVASVMYASNASSAPANAFTVGVGYYSFGSAGSDVLRWLSYIDSGSTYNNIHYVGGVVTSGTHAIQVTKSGSNWTTYGDGTSLKVLPCPATGCPSSFRFAGVATNTNGPLNDLVLNGSFSSLKVDAGGNDQNWSVKATALKCDGTNNGSDFVSVSYSNANAASIFEVPSNPTYSCSPDISFGWLYNESQGSWGT